MPPHPPVICWSAPYAPPIQGSWPSTLEAHPGRLEGDRSLAPVVMSHVPTESVLGPNLRCVHRKQWRHVAVTRRKLRFNLIRSPAAKSIVLC